MVAVSFISAAAVVTLLAKFGDIKAGKASDRIYQSAQSDGQLRPAAWFETKPSSFADLAEKVQPAVVNINTSHVVKRQEMTPFPHFGPNDQFDEFFNKFFEGMPKEQTQRALGSGFIINKEGDILTNYHVVNGADDIEVKISDGRKFKAKVVGKDEKSDIALLKISKAGDLPYVTLGDSNALRPGDWVMAIGNPFGLEHTVTVGVVSALGRILGGGTYAKYIQTDASINPGNSGGPLFNLKGEVVGINTMIYAAGQGIGFAIPIDLAKEELPQLTSKGQVTRGWLGVAIQDITPELAKSFNLTEDKGALIAEVYPDSPAAKGGMMRGDVVKKFNGKEIDDPTSLSLEVGTMQPGSDVDMVIVRGGKDYTIKVKLGKSEGEKTAAAGETAKPEATSKADVMGLVVESISPELASRLDLPAGYKGVVVSQVEPGSAAEGADIHSGDVIMEVNNAKVSSVDDYVGATKNMKKGDIIRLLLKRGHASIYVAFRA